MLTFNFLLYQCEKFATSRATGETCVDMDYTVFGEIVEGLDVLEKISLVPTDPNNRPKQDVKMKVKIL